jgi:hypothetical protein
MDVAVAVALALAACRTPTNEPPPPGDVPYTISIDDAHVAADGLTEHPLAITGEPGRRVVLKLDRATAGRLMPDAITLDDAGHATVSYRPCTHLAGECVGPATISLATFENPLTVQTTLALELAVPDQIGELAPCQSQDNVMYVHSAMFGVQQSSPTAAWNVVALPDSLELDVAATGRATFSLLEVGQPITTGVYVDARRAGSEPPGHPGLEVQAGGSSCSSLAGRFQIHEYTADPVLGTPYAITIAFEQMCLEAPDYLTAGCVHYTTTAPVGPPPPDPTKVSVEVLQSSGNGAPDPDAIAILTDAGGTVVLDTRVDSLGRAEAALSGTGTLTAIQLDSTGTRASIHSYRGVVAGDHVVVNRPAKRGAQDQMVAGLVPPTGASTIALATSCGGGSWSQGTGPLRSDLTFFDSCRTPTFDMLSLASLPQGTQFVWQTGLVHVPNGNVTVATDWAPLGTASIVLDHVPASSPQVGVFLATAVGASAIEMGRTLLSPPTPGTQSVQFPYPTGAGDAAVVQLVIDGSNLVRGEGRTIVVAGAPSTVTVDLASQPIPVPSGVQQTATGATWTETSGGVADVRTVAVRAALANGNKVTWLLVEPYDGHNFTSFPALPASHGGFDLTADPQAQLAGASVAYVDYDVVSGFTLESPGGPRHEHAASAQTVSMSFPF